MSYFAGVKLIDEAGAAYGVKHIANKPRVSAMPYLYDIAEGNVSGHAAWAKIGFNGALVAATEADLWSGTGVINFPVAETKMEVISAGTNAANDDCTVLRGDATGDTVTSDAGGTTLTLVDADVDFSAGGGTAVVAGDALILDPHGTTPEWGYITTVDTHTLTVAGGFSSGGTGASRKYAVLDYSAHSGAQAVKVEYLDDAYAQHSEIILTDNTNAVESVNADFYRINSFRVIVAGSGAKAAGNLSLRDDGGSPVHSYITAGFTRARNSAYSVPASKKLYVVQFVAGYAYAHNSTHYCRIYTRANVEPSTLFNTGNIFYPFTEVLCSNSSQLVLLEAPTMLPAKTDLKVSALAEYAGMASVALRGWLE